MMNVTDFVDARLYENEETLIQDALRHLLRARPDLRIQLAIHEYQQRGASLGKAAHVAGVSWAQMKEILLERGVPLKLGVEDIEQARRDAAALRDEFGAVS